MRVVFQRAEEQFQRAGRVALRDQVPRQGRPRAPLARGRGGEPLAQGDEAVRAAFLDLEGFESVQGQVGAIGRDHHGGFPDRGGAGRVPLSQAHVAQTQIRRQDGSVQFNGRCEAAARFGKVALADGLQPELMFKERQDRP